MTDETAEPQWFHRCVECYYVDRTVAYATPQYSPSDMSCPVCGGKVWDAVPRDYGTTGGRLTRPRGPYEGYDLHLHGSVTTWKPPALRRFLFRLRRRWRGATSGE